MLRLTVGFLAGLCISYLLSHSDSFWKWLNRISASHVDRINRQRAENIAIRFDMDRHPAEKGEHWR